MKLFILLIGRVVTLGVIILSLLAMAYAIFRGFPIGSATYMGYGISGFIMGFTVHILIGKYFPEFLPPVFDFVKAITLCLNFRISDVLEVVSIVMTVTGISVITDTVINLFLGIGFIQDVFMFGCFITAIGAWSSISLLGWNQRHTTIPT